MDYQDLKILDELRKSGAITEEEYQKEKQKILDGTGNWSWKKGLLCGMKENSYIALMHVSILAGYFMVFVGFFIPVILWLMNRENSKKVDFSGKDIINFMLSWLIYSIGAVIIGFITMNIPVFLITLAIVELIFIIMAAIKTNNGECWKYPMTITFLR